jgi:hypothetical protein
VTEHTPLVAVPAEGLSWRAVEGLLPHPLRRKPYHRTPPLLTPPGCALSISPLRHRLRLPDTGGALPRQAGGSCRRLCSEQSHAYHTQEEPRVPLAFYRYFRTSPPAWPPAPSGAPGPRGAHGAGHCRGVPARLDHARPDRPRPGPVARACARHVHRSTALASSQPWKAGIFMALRCVSDRC